MSQSAITASADATAARAGADRKETALAQLAREVLQGRDIKLLLDETVRLVSAALEVQCCAIFQHDGEARNLLLRATWGLSSGLVRDFSCGRDEDSYFGLAYSFPEPLVVPDFCRETRFRTPLLLLDAGVRSGFTVTIPGDVTPFGVLGVYSAEQRSFDKNDLLFAKAMATLLATANNRTQVQSALRESELRYRLMVEGSEQVFFYVHDNNHVLQYASKSLFDVLGYEPEEVVGHRGEEFFAEDPENQIGIELTDGALKDGFRPPTYLSVLRHKDGHKVVLEAVESPVWKKGVVVGMQGFARDVTERIDAQKRLEEKTAYLNALIHYSPLGIVVLDPERRVTMCNTAFELIFGFIKDDIVGCCLDDCIVPKDFVLEAMEITRRVQAGEIIQVSTRRTRKDGTLVDVELHGVPLILNGKRIGSFAIYQDITERKKAETSLRQLSGRLLQMQDEERRRLARELHDSTAQTLAALSMSLEALSQSLTAKMSAADRRNLTDGMRLAEQSAREVRTLSYLLHPPLLDEVGLASAVRWYATGFSKRTGVQVKVEMTAKLRRLPRELETALFRIVQESLTNIHRHSRSRTARIRLRLYSDTIMLEISDSGQGFKNQTGFLTKETAPIGVGIAGMYERVKQLNGQFEIKSHRGTTVRAVLPLSC